MSSDSPISVLPFAAANYVTLLNINPSEALTSSVQLSVAQSRFPRLVVVPGFNNYTPLSLGTHDVTDVENFACAWYQVLDANDVITSATVVCNPSGPAISNVLTSGSTVVWDIGNGGVVGQTYKCVISIVTAAGLQLHKSCQFDAVSLD